MDDEFRPPDDTGRLYWIDGSRLMSEENETAEGWRLPVTGALVSYLYVNPDDFAFEIWLGGESDITVRLQRPFMYGPPDALVRYDPASVRKSDLGPLLNIGNERVSDLLVQRTGELDLTFRGGNRLVASPSDVTNAWRLEWPVEGMANVAAGVGGGLAWNVPVGWHPVADRSRDATTTSGPVTRGSILVLPIAGVISKIPVNSPSIELLIPLAEGGHYSMHFGGAIEIAGGNDEVWRGRGDADDRSTLARYLDLLGERVVEAHVDEQEQFHLAFASGARLTAKRDTWEANWPKSDGTLEDYWVPREGPRIP